LSIEKKGGGGLKYNYEESINKFKEFFQTYHDPKNTEDLKPKYYKAIDGMVANDEVSLLVDFDDIIDFDNDLADQYLNEPNLTIPAPNEGLKLAVTEQIHPQKEKKYFVRVHNLPKTHTLKVKDIAEDQVHKLIQITGVVTLASYKDFYMHEAMYSCAKCGEYIPIKSDNYFVANKPLECTNPACGRKGPFKIVDQYCKSTLIQTLKINDFPEDMKSGEIPEDFDCIVEGDLVGKVLPGNKVEVVGVLALKQTTVGRGETKSPVYTKYLKGMHIRPIGVEEELSNITDEEIEEIKKIAQTPNLKQLMISSFCPLITERDYAKYALLLQAFGRPQKILDDGTKIRGDSHILLMGDPGTGKSQLIQFATKLSARGIFATGKGVTSAGLTGSAVQLSDRRWTIQPGVLSLADGGIAGIDEFSRMEMGDRDAIHTALEQQEVPQHKAGLKVTLQARCAVCATANPIHDRFDNHKPFTEQFNLPSTIIGRFDMIFCIIDDTKQDDAIAKHVTNVHAKGNKVLKANGEIPIDLMRKYITYARKNIFPEYDDGVLVSIQEWYKKTRCQGGGDKPTTATTRQLEAILRLVYANARMRLSNKIEDRDFRDVMQLYEEARKIMIDPETNNFDVDMIETGRPKSQRDKITIVMGIIQQNDKKYNGEGAKTSEIYEDARAEGIPDTFIRKTIEDLKQKGDVYEPRPDRLKLTLI